MRVLQKCVVGVLAFATGAACASTSPDAVTSSSEAATTVAVATSVDEPPPTTETLTTETLTMPLASLPEPPAPMALTGTPQEQAVQLADAFEQHDESRAPALLAAFGAAGVAVLDAAERPLTPLPDTVGMTWVFVYTVSTAPNYLARIPLSEVARLFDADGMEPRLDVAAVAAELVGGLRTALAGDSAVPGPTMLALLVQEEARRAGGVDLADPAVTADQISVSVPTAALLVSAGVLVATSRHTLTAHPPVNGVVGSTVRAAGLPPGCATDSDGQWALWLVSKIAAGTDIPGVARTDLIGGDGWDGIFGSVIKHLESFYPGGIPPGLKQLKDGFGKVSSVAGFAAATLTALSAFVAALTYGAQVSLKEGEPLIRTKKSGADGAPGTIVVSVGFDYGKLDQRTLDAVNCLLSVLVVLGNNSTMPTSGPAKGVSVTIEGMEGFGHGLVTEGSYVLLNMPLTKDTDDAGVAEFSVIGRRQRVDIPETAPPVDRWFSVAVEAQPDPTDAEGLTKVFLDSFLCAGGALSGKVTACVDPIADIVRQTKWDLGTWRFRLVDWVQDYKVDAVMAGLHFQATKCAGIAGTWEFTVNTTVGNYQPTTTLIVQVDRDPVPGGAPVAVVSAPLRFYDPVVRVGYEENFSFDFYGDGADSQLGATPGAPAVGIDEVFGGGVYTLVAGNFC